MVNCCVATCKSYDAKKSELDDGIIYHAFPKDKALAKKWILACKRKDRKSSMPKSWDKICSLHFCDSDYKRDLENEILGLSIRKRRFLKPGSIPSLYMPSSTNEKSQKSRSSGTLTYNIRQSKLAVKNEGQNAYKSKYQAIIKLRNKTVNNGSEVGNKASRNRRVQAENPTNALNKRRDMTFCDEYFATRLAQFTRFNQSHGERIVGMKEAGMSMVEIGNQLGITRQTVSKWIRRWEKESNLRVKLRTVQPKMCGKVLGYKNRKEIVIDLSKKNMKILNYSEKVPEKEVTHLILNDNKIENLPLISCFPNLEKISLANNQIDDIGWFTLIPNLKVLDAPNNKISCIQALTHLCHLTHLNLSGNQIVSLKGYDPKRSSELEYLDLSNNKISTLIHFPELVKLKVLKLSGNMLSSLVDWSRHLPPSIKVLELSNNLLEILLDFRNISFLKDMETISIKNNPCVSENLFSDQTGNSALAACHYYRPYLIALCPTLKTIDEKDITKTENSVADILKQEDWLHKFIANDDLVNYLASVCPREKIATDLNGYKLKEASLILKRLTSKVVQNGLGSSHQKRSSNEVNSPNSHPQPLTSTGELHNLSVTSNRTSLPSTVLQEVIIALPGVDDYETEDEDSLDKDSQSLNEEPQSVHLIKSPLHSNPADLQFSPRPSTLSKFLPQAATINVSQSEPLNMWDTSLQVQQKRVEIVNNLHPGCANSCNHYIELIEEKARSHLYERVNDDLVEKLQLLAARNQQIMDRNVQLEKILLENMIPFEIKIEDDELP